MVHCITMRSFPPENALTHACRVPSSFVSEIISPFFLSETVEESGKEFGEGRKPFPVGQWNNSHCSGKVGTHSGNDGLETNKKQLFFCFSLVLLLEGVIVLK